MRDTKDDIKGIVKSLGLVFGDIGTSPIYTFTIIFLLTKVTEANITGVLSLIIWTLVILVTVEYAWLAMSLGKKGEGGTIVLRELLIPLLKSSRKIAFITFLTFVGISLIMGDGVITPAISILSAVEGILLIPGCAATPEWFLIFIAAAIAVILFFFQRKGTEKVAGAFGPIMLIWFLALGISGISALLKAPQMFNIIFSAVNPWCGIHFILKNGLSGFFVLSEVILCATGGEALYADMGHLGRKPIIRAWLFVFIALTLSYLGQGAFLINNPNAKNVLFEMILHEAKYLYIPFLVLSIIATIIASQAMISGMFSIVYQGITTRIMPMFKVEYTSAELRSQIYISFVNWFLLFFVLLVMFYFKRSSNLAAAYGLAVTGTMSFTGIMMTWIFFLKKRYLKTLTALFVTFVDILFLIANTSKIPHGGYWSLIIASIPLAIILIYTNGQKRLYKSLQPIPLEIFLKKYNKLYKSSAKIKGSALYFARDIKNLPPYIANTMFINNIIYEDNIIVSINIMDNPFCINAFFKENPAAGLRTFEIQAGYMEVIDMEEILKQAGIKEKVIFYGIEDITTGNILWNIFAAIKRLTPAFVQFYKLPSRKLHGIITRIEI